MKELISQPSALPTRKVFVGAMVALVTGVAIQISGDTAKAVPMLEPYMDYIKIFAPIGIGYAASYFFRDSAKT